MKENEWTNYVKEVLQSSNLGNNIFLDTLNKIPYAQEVLSYDLDFNKHKKHTMSFETDPLFMKKIAL